MFVVFLILLKKHMHQQMVC